MPPARRCASSSRTTSARSVSSSHAVASHAACSASGTSSAASNSSSSRCQCAPVVLTPPSRGLARGVELLVEPGTRVGPVALDGALADAEHLRDLLLREPAEEAVLDERAQPRLHLPEPLERLVEGDELLVA